MAMPGIDPKPLAGCFADIGQTISTHRAESSPRLSLAAVKHLRKVGVNEFGQAIELLDYFRA